MATQATISMQKCNVYQRGYKAPLFKHNQQEWERFFIETKAALLSMTFEDGTSVAESRRWVDEDMTALI